MTAPVNTTSGGAWTPGPWIADAHHTRVDAGRTMGFVRAPSHLVPLAAVVLGVEGMSQDEGRANLKLMASAPALYAALKWFIDDIDGTHSVMTEFDDAVTAARSALSAAPLALNVEGGRG